MKRSKTITAVLAVFLLTTVTSFGKPPDDLFKRDRYLVLDSRIIKSKGNAKLTLGTVKKHLANPLFKEDKPWEPRFDNVYADVIYDEEEKLYKCWYNPFIIDERVTSTPPEKRNPDSLRYVDATPAGREIGLCYAFSTDGIHWEKPELGIIEFDGNKKNNIVMRPRGAAAVFKDPRDPDPARRYKILVSGDEQHGVRVTFSPDGLHWSEPIRTPEIVECGAQPTAFWAPDLDKYMGIARQWSHPAPGVRQVTRTESSDFVHWTPTQLILEGPNPRLQTHDMTVFPTCGIYLGLVGVMEWPEDVPHHSDLHVKQHCELAWSPDSITWHRIQEGTPFIGHSLAKTQHYGTLPYDWGVIFAADPIFLSGEVRIYYGACDGYFFGWRKGYLALATLRPNGWAGYEQIERNKPASITTTPLLCTGDKLQLSADIPVSGSITVTLLDKDNRELAVGETIKQTVTDAQVKWPEIFSLEKLTGKEIRLRFDLRDAKFYSFAFTDTTDNI